MIQIIANPDYNPIEMSFVRLKTWMRAHERLAEEYAEVGKFAAFIELAISKFQEDADMEGPWRQAGLL